MANQSPSEIQELKPETVPGYRAVFLVCFAVMAAYLGAILFLSPGQAKKKDDQKKKEPKTYEAPKPK